MHKERSQSASNLTVRLPLFRHASIAMPLTARPVILLAAALLLGGGVALGGFAIGTGFTESRLGDRYVTMKGLAERDVGADLALWPLRFTATGNDLANVQRKIDGDVAAVTEFLTASGLPAEAVERQRLEVTDIEANPYRPEGVRDRFIIAQTLLVRTTDVDKIVDLSRRVGELVSRGVILGEGVVPRYVFTRLNDVKPEMIAEATRNAREGAAQFAADSGSTVGSIRRASQGVFQILPRDDGMPFDESASVEKKIRIVSTIDYYLAD